MTHFPDLSPCGYFSGVSDDRLIAVGWLESGHDYTSGELSDSVVSRLTELLVNPWQPSIAMGQHDCSFCRFSGGPRTFTFNNSTIEMGISNLFIPTKDQIFVAPSLIVHYMDAHNYAPPDVFCDAVMACPEMRSMPYLKAIRNQSTKEMFDGIPLDL